MTAEPRTAPWTKGKPCTATAVSDVSGTAWAEIATSATTSTAVNQARTRATRAALTSGHRSDRCGEHDPDPGPRPRRGADVELAAHGLDPLAHVGEPRAVLAGARLEAAAV